MRDRPTYRIPPAIYGAFAGAAVAILADQISELAIGLYPYKFGEVGWRFGAFGLAVSKTTWIVFGDALLALAAVGLGSRLGLRIWAVAHLVAAVVMGLALTAFGLDLLQLRPTIRPEVTQAFLLAGIRAALVTGVVVAVWLWAGLVGLRSTRTSGSKRPQSPLLVGRPTGLGASPEAGPEKSPGG